MSCIETTLLILTGANIPGKRREALIYAAGLPLYLKTIWESADDGYRGFDMV